MTKVDMVVGTSFGDEAKGKIVYDLLRKNDYTHVAVCSGGSNKGHAIYHNGQRIVTHQIPAGVFFNKKSVICCGCVVNPLKLRREINELEAIGIEAAKNIKVAYNAHVISEAMIEEDNQTNAIGSTGQGIMQAYRAKYGRVGMRAEEHPLLKEFLIDTVEEFHENDCYILVEGAQGAMLCPDWSNNYPYVTSGIPTSTYALHSLGVGAKHLNHVYGAAKAYVTYSGYMDFQPKDDETLKQIQSIGKEIGNTSGRVRQVDYLNLKLLKRAILINGVNTLVVSKMDVLQQVNKWKLYGVDGKLREYPDEAYFKFLIEQFAKNNFDSLKVIFSYSPERI